MDFVRDNPGEPNFARIVKGGWAKEPPANVKIWSKLQHFSGFCPTWVTQYTDPCEIKPVNIDHWPTVA